MTPSAHLVIPITHKLRNSNIFTNAVCLCIMNRPGYELPPPKVGQFKVSRFPPASDSQEDSSHQA